MIFAEKVGSLNELSYPCCLSHCRDFYMLTADFSLDYKASISFDDNTVTGSHSYVTVNLHHASRIQGNSKVGALRSIRVRERARGEHLAELISDRLKSAGVSERETSLRLRQTVAKTF